MAWRVRWNRQKYNPWRVIDDLSPIDANRESYDVVPLYDTPHEFAVAYRAMLSARPAPLQEGAKADGGWMPIETAPKDGTPMLLAFPWSGRMTRHIGTWNADAQSWMVGETVTGFHFVPHMQGGFTHWQPLPSTASLSPEQSEVGK